MQMVLFLLAFVLAPKHGVLAARRKAADTLKSLRDKVSS